MTTGKTLFSFRSAMRAGLALAFAAAAGAGWAQSANTTLTESTSRTETFVDTQQAARQDLFSTRLLGILDGSTTVVYTLFGTRAGGGGGGGGGTVPDPGSLLLVLRALAALRLALRRPVLRAGARPA